VTDSLIEDAIALEWRDQCVETIAFLSKNDWALAHPIGNTQKTPAHGLHIYVVGLPIIRYRKPWCVD